MEAFNTFLKDLRDAAVKFEIQRIQTILKEMKLLEEGLNILHYKLIAPLPRGIIITNRRELQDEIYRTANFSFEVVSKEDIFIEKLIERFNLPIEPNSTYVSISEDEKMQLLELKMHSFQLMKRFHYFINVYNCHWRKVNLLPQYTDSIAKILYKIAEYWNLFGLRLKIFFCCSICLE